jgi:AcrR family transcriptional regulator
MPRSPEPTRNRLLDAALELFAEKGISGTSLREIRIRAGQRNTAAAHYHFGEKRNLVQALLQREWAPVADRRRALLASADDLHSIAAVIVLPAAELATGNAHQRLVVQFLSEVFGDIDQSRQEISNSLSWKGSELAYAMLVERVPFLPGPTVQRRAILAQAACLYLCALRAKQGRWPEMLDVELFQRYIVDVFLAAVFVEDRSLARDK